MTAVKICPQCGTQYDADVRFCSRDGTTLKSQGPAGDLVGAVVADRYHVLKKLGEGGMGQVYLAQHVKMGRKSAVKVMHPAMVHDADAISRFNREASNAAQISHPNVAGIYDFGETADGLIYLAMEYVEGEPLTALLAREGPLPPPRAAAIVRQVADALAAAHDLGIVHRDLKPDNIMIARGRAGQDLVKVVDFGIAKAAGNDKQNVTKTGFVVGTIEYMSPEQLAGSALDGRSDLYALGIVAFNALTGKLPFPANTPSESMIMRLTEDPKRLDQMRPDIAWPAALQATLDRALARDPEHRYASVIEFGQEFSAAAGAAPAATAPMVAPQRVPATPPSASAALPPTRAPAEVPPQAPVSPTRPSAAGGAAAPAASTGRSKLPLLLGGSALLLATAAGGAFMMLKGDGESGGASSGQSTSVVPTGDPASPPVTYGASTGATTATTPPSPDPALAAEREALADLDRYEKLLEESALSQADARVTAARLREILGSVRTHDDSLRARIALVSALDNAKDTRAMCTEIAGMLSEGALSRVYQTALSDLRREHCQPQRPAPAY